MKTESVSHSMLVFCYSFYLSCVFWYPKIKGQCYCFLSVMLNCHVSFIRMEWGPGTDMYVHGMTPISHPQAVIETDTGNVQLTFNTGKEVIQIFDLNLSTLRIVFLPLGMELWLYISLSLWMTSSAWPINKEFEEMYWCITHFCIGILKNRTFFITGSREVLDFYNRLQRVAPLFVHLFPV